MKKIISIALYAAVVASAIPQMGCFLVRSAARAGSKLQARRDFEAQTSCTTYDAEHVRSVHIAPPAIAGYAVTRGEAVTVTGCGQTQTYLCFLAADDAWHCR